jgi:hypothetical protein
LAKSKIWELSSKILVNMIAHIGTNPATDARWWGVKLYRKIGMGAWSEVTGANGTETGAAANIAGTPVWVSHNLGSSGTDYQYLIANIMNDQSCLKKLLKQ